jgi:hypothetical protein
MHEIHNIKRVSVCDTYSLDLLFEDGATRHVDLSGVLAGELYGPLRDPRLFAQVTIDPEFETVVWPNGADFDPETLYNWEKYRRSFEARARSWSADS